VRGGAPPAATRNFSEKRTIGGTVACNHVGRVSASERVGAPPLIGDAESSLIAAKD
jgi:hypothetical protein